MKQNKILVVGNDNCIIKVASICTKNMFEIKMCNELQLNLDKSVMIHSCMTCDNNILILDSYNCILCKYDFENNKITECITGKDPRHLCRSNENIYVTNFESNSISIVDYEGCFLVGTIIVGLKPHDIIEYKGKLYITCYEENCILEYDLCTNNKKFIHINGKPMHIRRYENKLYILSYYIDGDTKTIINQVDLCTYENRDLFLLNEVTNNFIIDNDLNLILVLSTENEVLYVLDMKNMKKNQIHFNGYLEDISVDEQYIYIVNSDKKSMIVIDKLNFEEKYTIKLGFTPMYIDVI